MVEVVLRMSCSSNALGSANTSGGIVVVVVSTIGFVVTVGMVTGVCVEIGDSFGFGGRTSFGGSCELSKKPLSICSRSKKPPLTSTSSALAQRTGTTRRVATKRNEAGLTRKRAPGEFFFDLGDEPYR